MSRIVRFHQFGAAEMLQIDELVVSPPEPNEVRIAVKAIGLNRAESMFRLNAYIQEAILPSQLGYEAAGIIEAIGSDVHDFKIGDQVSVVPTEDMGRWGTYGELINIPARHVVKHPENISFEQAAASWLMYLTAWGALIEQAKLIKDEFVLITAASSSVGVAAFQVAHSVGAKVIATTRSNRKKQFLLDLGADYVIATDDEDLHDRVMEITQNKGIRVVFDPIGGPQIALLTAIMAPRGILFEYGALSSEKGVFPQFDILGKALTIKGFLYNEIVENNETFQRAKAYVLKGLATGTLTPCISRVFPFEEIQDATRFLESNEQVGKIVVTVP